MSQHLLVGGIAALHIDLVSCLCDTLLKSVTHSLTHLSEVFLVKRARSGVQSFVLFPLDWELIYITGLKTVKMHTDVGAMHNSTRIGQL